MSEAVPVKTVGEICKQIQYQCDQNIKSLKDDD